MTGFTPVNKRNSQDQLEVLKNKGEERQAGQEEGRVGSANQFLGAASIVFSSLFIDTLHLTFNGQLTFVY